MSWFEDDGHVRGHLNLWIFKLYTQILNCLKNNCWDPKFVGCPTHFRFLLPLTYKLLVMNKQVQIYYCAA